MPMQVPVTKLVFVKFVVTHRRFLHPDGIYSWHDLGDVTEIETEVKLGRGMRSQTGRYPYTFALNKKDIEYIPSIGIEYVCFVNPITQKEYAIETPKIVELVKTRLPINIRGSGTGPPYYLIYHTELTGETVTS